MNVIYDQLKDKYVAAVVVYAVGGKAYEDAEGTKGVTPEVLKDLFIKGTLVVDVEGALYRAIGYTEAGAVYQGGTVAGVEAEA